MTDEPKKRQYQLSSKEKAKRAALRAVKTAEKAVVAENKKLALAAQKVQLKKQRVRKKASAAQHIADQITGTQTKKGRIVTEDQIKVVGPALQNLVKEKDILFQPHPGPQTAFLSSSETEVLYGGAAGGGKSYAMLIDPLRYCENTNHRALLVRKSMPELLELLDLSRQLYPQAFPGCKFREQEKRWVFPSGATIQFSFIDSDHDVYRFQGQSFTWIGIDELTHYETPYVWDYLRSRLRRTDLRITPYMRATTNPGGLGGWWVKKMFIDPAPYGEAFWATDIDSGTTLTYPDIDQVEPRLRGSPIFKRRFIPAKLTDNPSLMLSPEYMGMLASLPEVQRRRLLEGDWDVSEGAAFPEFDRQIHVMPAFDAPNSLFRFRACDYGYVAPTAVIWFAVDYDGTLYAYRELYETRLDAGALAEKIHELEADEPSPISTGILDNECWSRRGQIGPSIAETMIGLGINWSRADKGPGSRINGKMELHRRLAVDPYTEKPGLIISEACPNLIRILPTLPSDPIKQEDVDTKYKEDHLYDALRYGVQSRSVRQTEHPSERRWRAQAETYTPVDQTFGY